MPRQDNGRTFVVADLPGLIEGAHEGVGLGIRFLKHVERTRLIAHLVDTSDANDRDPVHDFEIIERELAAFSPALAEKPMIVVATKLDATTDRDAARRAARVRGEARPRIPRDFVGKRRGHRRTGARNGERARRIPKPSPPRRTRPRKRDARAQHDRRCRTSIRRRCHDGGAASGGTLISQPAHESPARGITARWRFSAGRSIPCTRATSPWRRRRSGDSISTQSTSFLRRARRTSRSAS